MTTKKILAVQFFWSNFDLVEYLINNVNNKLKIIAIVADIIEIYTEIIYI